MGETCRHQTSKTKGRACHPGHSHPGKQAKPPVGQATWPLDLIPVSGILGRTNSGPVRTHDFSPTSTAPPGPWGLDHRDPPFLALDFVFLGPTPQCSGAPPGFLLGRCPQRMSRDLPQTKHVPCPLSHLPPALGSSSLVSPARREAPESPCGHCRGSPAEGLCSVDWVTLRCNLVYWAASHKGAPSALLAVARPPTWRSGSPAFLPPSAPLIGSKPETR